MIYVRIATGSMPVWPINKMPIFAERKDFSLEMNDITFLMVGISKKHNWRTGVSIPVPLECESSALPFELVPLTIAESLSVVSRRTHFVRQGFPPSLFCIVNKTSLFFENAHVRMAERSKAPDSRVELFLTGVFWSTNVGVGSNPTSDKRFRN